MQTLSDIEREIVASFNALNNVDDKYALLFRLGASLPPMDPSLKTDANLVKGCQSSLWFPLEQEDDRFHLQADSDSMVIKGIASLMVRLIEGRTADEVLSISMDFIDQIKIWKLPSERHNGLMAMLDHVHAHARSLQAGEPTGLPNLKNEDKVRPV